MDYLKEGIALGVDLVLFAACMQQYYKYKNAVALIQGAPYLSIDKDLEETIKTLPQRRLPYAAIRGVVEPLSKPIISNNNANVTGVVQLLKLKEHVMQRGSSGFWANIQRVVQEVHNVTPFAITNKGILVEVTDPLVADVLDMDVISDVFNPYTPRVIDHIWGFLLGVRPRGVQSTEEMLREGTSITGIGELVYCQDSSGLELHPPCDGAPYYLTKMHLTSLLRKLQSSRYNYKLLCIMLGTIGIVIGGIVVRKYWKHRNALLLKARRRAQEEERRRNRRRQMRDLNIPTSQLCVACRTNPLEIILLPCGHVCLCEDCSRRVSTHCPVCRSPIEFYNVAFL